MFLDREGALNMSAIVNFNFNPFPSLTTESLTLRQINSEDEHEFHILKSDSQILRYLNSKPKTFDESRYFLQKIKDGIVKNEWILWGITEKNNNKLIGTVCLWNISEDHLILLNKRLIKKIILSRESVSIW